MKIVQIDHDVEPITLSDFLEIAQDRFDPDKIDTVMDMAEPLVALSANVNEIFALIHRQLYT